MPKKHLNSFHEEHSEGAERRLELMRDILDSGTFYPKTVVYKDIDQAFKEWVEKDLPIVSDDGVVFPTMALYSNQRFSEYTQSWKYTDENKNLILNFKTVKRENNPQFGKIQSGLWNIPGERYYLLKRVKCLDDNGTESFLELRAKQPMPIDFTFTLTIFTTKIQSINDFNMMVNEKFKARQCYLQPNGYYMAMTLESISDQSQYNITDRQFYAQSYKINLLGFVIQEEDFKTFEVPLKTKVDLELFSSAKNPEVEIDEPETDNPYYYRPAIVTITFNENSNRVSTFTIDTDFVCDDIGLDNILRTYNIQINGERVERTGFTAKENDKIRVQITKRRTNEKAVLTLYGHNPNVILDERKDNLLFTKNENPKTFLQEEYIED